MNFGKEAIPDLINNIDNNKKGYSGSFDPENSNLKELNNFNGIHAAYVIELILSGGDVNLDNKKNYKRYLLFIRNIIIKNAGYQPLEYKDVVTIKQLYQTWWAKNKEKSISELNKNWQNRKRPLQGSSYNWF
ncbi:hypothetical protein ACFGVR_15405 [Mucilaginibacter sp. AW1-3]